MTRRGRSRVLPFLVVGTALLAPSGGIAQSGDGSTGAALGGAALGAVSGSILALSGGLGGCNRTLYPSRCSRITTITGAVVGLAAGAVIGWESRSALDDRLKTAGYGTILGAAGGIALKYGLQHYGCLRRGAGRRRIAPGREYRIRCWSGDRAPAVAPPPLGGARRSRRVGPWGMAVGGLTDWVVDAVRGGADTGSIPIQFSIPW